MLKIPFRYALSTIYAKFIIEDIILAAQSLTSAGLFNLLVLIDPSIQWYQFIQTNSIRSQESELALQKLHKDLSLDPETDRVVKEVCIDLEIGEIKVFMWNKMNAGYVFRRVYLPAGWKDLFSENELKAIIGHELGHLKLGADALIPLRLVNKIGDEILYSLIPAHATGYLLLLSSIMTQNITYIKMMSLSLFFRIIHFMVENFFSRKDEYEADQYGVKVAGQEAMKNALSKIDIRARVELLENLNYFPYVKQAFYHWLLKKDTGRFRELLLDHPFLHKRLKTI
ncbi:MAG TPA: M48 family metallopeptidase [Bacillota bacterium]|nr:M48 family metallopeptidase [Bacillota bacterium]